MANLIRREEYGTPSLLRKSMNDLFENFFGTGVLSPLGDLTNHQNAWAVPLPIDVIDTGREYLVKANLPGIEKKDVDIQLNDNVLTIQGSYSQATENKNERYLLQERRQGAFSRSIGFREDIISNNVTASFKDGILEIAIPKAEQKQPSSIKINISE